MEKREEEYLSTSNARAQRVRADTNFFVHIRISKIIPTTSHGANENGDVVSRRQSWEVPRKFLRWCIAREGFEEEMI